jgi:peptidoglycan-associated lipoprotein
VRIVLGCGLLLAAVGVAPAAAQTSPSTTQPATSSQTSTTETRPALPTFFGDTGLWFVPTAATLPGHRASGQLFRANWDDRQGLTDVNEIGLTGAFGVSNRAEIFGSWKVVRLRRAVRSPVYLPSDTSSLAGLDQAFPYLRRGWSKTLGGPIIVGAKYAVLSESLGDQMSLAPRVALEIGGVPWAGTNAIVTHVDLVGSREIKKAVELTASFGGVLRQNSDDFNETNGLGWGVGAIFGTRSRVRGLAEYVGEWATADSVVVRNPPYVAEDFSIAPIFSNIPDQTHMKLGAVFQARSGAFIYAGVNHSQHTGDRLIAGHEATNQAWGFDVRVGWHPGVKVYVPPPPPPPVIREVIREVPAPAPPPPPPANRPPVFNGPIQANPPVLEPGQSTNLSAPATDPDGDTITYTWSAPAGSFNSQNGMNTIWTAPNQEGNYPLTVTANDGRGGVATNSITIPVMRRAALVFDDVHFDFDKSNLKPEAIRILDDAVMKLQANPGLNVTIEGHTDSVGTAEYNLSLGERRANAVRDYLLNRGIAASRMRTVSYGEERPIDTNDTDAGRAMNRRAHIVTMTIQ